MTARNRAVGGHLLRALVRLVVWIAVLAGSHLVLTTAAATLPTPPAPWDLDAVTTWMSATEPASAAFAVLRVVALAVTWYLAAVTAVALAARLSGSHPLAAVAEAIALPFARRLLRHVLGAGLAVSLGGGLVPLVGGVASAQPAPTAAPAVTMHATGTPGAPTDGPILTMRAAAPETTDARSLAGAMARRIEQRAPAPHVTMHAVTRAATWTAEPGDHLWHIAAATLESSWSRPPTDDEVTGYWRTLVAANRDRLPVPGNADVIYPGQVFTLPPVPPA